MASGEILTQEQELQELRSALESGYDERRGRALGDTNKALYRALIAYLEDYDGNSTSFVDYVVSQIHIPLVGRGGNQAVVDWYRNRADERAAKR